MSSFDTRLGISRELRSQSHEHMKLSKIDVRSQRILTQNNKRLNVAKHLAWRSNSQPTNRFSIRLVQVSYFGTKTTVSDVVGKSIISNHCSSDNYFFYPNICDAELTSGKFEPRTQRQWE